MGATVVKSVRLVAILSQKDGALFARSFEMNRKWILLSCTCIKRPLASVHDTLVGRSFVVRVGARQQLVLRSVQTRSPGQHLFLCVNFF